MYPYSIFQQNDYNDTAKFTKIDFIKIIRAVLSYVSLVCAKNATEFFMESIGEEFPVNDKRVLIKYVKFVAMISAGKLALGEDGTVFPQKIEALTREQLAGFFND